MQPLFTLFLELHVEAGDLRFRDAPLPAQLLLDQFVDGNEKFVTGIAHLRDAHLQRSVRIVPVISDCRIAVLLVRDGFDVDLQHKRLCVWFVTVGVVKAA